MCIWNLATTATAIFYCPLQKFKSWANLLWLLHNILSCRPLAGLQLVVYRVTFTWTGSLPARLLLPSPQHVKGLDLLPLIARRGQSWRRTKAVSWLKEPIQTAVFPRVGCPCRGPNNRCHSGKSIPGHISELGKLPSCWAVGCCFRILTF